MAYDITVHHPLYDEFFPAWKLMRDAFDGEDKIKAAKELYLPMKSGTKAITDITKRDEAYNAYQKRAEFPELVSPTVRGSVGIMLKTAAKIELPASMEPLREKATQDGLTLDALHRRIAVELMTMGRYGLMPGIGEDGTPYLAGYITESIINWDATKGVNDYLVLDESMQVRDLETGKWGCVEQYRECSLTDGAFASREWVKNAKGTWDISEPVSAMTRKNEALAFLPFVFIDTNDLTAEPDDVPLYGLGRIAVRIYRLDADYTFALHMTSEPTPVATGFDDPVSAVKENKAPRTLGSAALWLLPAGADAKFLEFTGAGIGAQKTAISDALNRAIAFGAQILTDTQKTAESGDAIQLRLNNQTSILRMIAITSASGLEKALRNIAIWLGEDPNAVTVTPNLEFFDEVLSAQDLTALVAGWQAGAYSFPSMFDRLKRGQIVPIDRTPEQEQELIAKDDAGLPGKPVDLAQAGIIPKGTPQPSGPQTAIVP